MATTEQHKPSPQHVIDQIGYHEGHTLPSNAAKWGNIARALDLILGARWDAAGDLGTDIAALIAALSGLAQQRPTMSLIEDWHIGVINPALWTLTNPATGTAWNINLGQIFPLNVVPNANENCRLVSVQPWENRGASWAPAAIGQARFINKRLILEFELTFQSDPARLDPAMCFWGLSLSAAATRATNNLAGFAIVNPGGGNQLQTVTDWAGVETVNTGFGETLLNEYHKFRIESAYDLATNSARVFFYLDEVLVATHTTNLPAGHMYLNWYTATNAGGAMFQYIGSVRTWLEDLAR